MYHALDEPSLQRGKRRQVRLQEAGDVDDDGGGAGEDGGSEG